MKTLERSHFGPREVGQIEFTAQDAADFSLLNNIGIGFPEGLIGQMAQYAMDDQQGGVTTASITTPIQFLQNWLPGFVRVNTAARKIDELVGITTTGSWEDEEVVQGVIENIGVAVPYGDYTNVPLSSWNNNYERRTVVRFEKGLQVGALEEARASRVRIAAAAEKRTAASLALEIQRNAVGFYGFNSGNNRTYGFLNDPSLPAYVTVATGAASSTLWSTKTFNEITADLRTAISALQTQSKGTIDPKKQETTLALALSVDVFLTVTQQVGGISVREWLRQNYPLMRVETAPQLNSANGGANVFYLYAEKVDDGASDDSRTWVQIVPAKFQALGVEKRSKSYVEDYVNATAGVMLKRPYAVVRYTGI